jgi:polysaccharide deacetylase 2 family uncharacterized protein YibQ
MADDLYAPLKRKAKEGLRLRIGVVPALIVCGLVAVSLGAFALFVHDPLGGEPYQIVSIPPEIPVAKNETPSPQPAPAEQFSAASTQIDPELDKIGHPTVSILTPGGEDGQMLVKTVTLPSEAQPASFIIAPDARVIEKSRFGLLPKIGADGTRPSKLYARLSEHEEKTAGKNLPKISILIGGLGLSQSMTAEAITKLPPQVTFAFAPYGSMLQAQVNKAREQGHEVMLQIPMEPFDYPANDPGPQTLLSTLSHEQNIERLYWCYSRFSGYTGIVNYLGAKFTANAVLMRPILEDARDRGLIFVDDGSSPRTVSSSLAGDLKLEYAKAQLTLDVTPSPDKIDEALAQLEQEARNKGHAIGIASALPVTLDRISKWSKDLERRGIALVPVSVMAGSEPNS